MPSRLLPVLLVAAVATGCRAPVESNAPASTPTAATPDSAPAVTAAPDSGAQDAVMVAVDSLRRETRQLAAAIENLRSRESVVPDSMSLEAMRAPAQQVAHDVRRFTFRMVWATILTIAAWMSIVAVAWALERLAELNARRRLLIKKAIPIVRLLIWGLALYYIVAQVFEVNRSGLLAATAALGVGIGFAAQGILKNIFGGLIIIFDQPFQVGDKIRVGGTYGEVVSIGMRATRIVTPDDNLVSVPNAEVVEGQVANANAGALDCQVVVDLFLPGDVDVARAKAIAMAAATNSPYVYLDKPVVVNVKDEYDHGFVTHLVVKAYVIDTRHEFALASDVTEAAKAEFHRLGIRQRAGETLPTDPQAASDPRAG